MDKIFKDLKVIELASVLAGPSVGMFFAELGATVTKYENKSTNGDVTRSWKLSSELKTEPVSAYFSSVNYKKEHVFIDFKNEQDLNQLKSQIKEADIVITNFKAGSAKKYQLDFESCSRTNSRLIYCQLNGFDSVKERVAFDVVLQAETGYMFMNGQPDNPPTKMPLAMMDILAAHQMKEGILCAMIEQNKDGKAKYVETSLEKSAIASLANQASNWLMEKHIPQRIGSLHPNIAPYGETFLTKDNKYIVLAIGSDRQFKNLCSILDASDISEDKQFQTNQLRIKNRARLEKLLALKIQNFNRSNLIELSTKHQIPVGAIKNMKEVFENPIAESLVRSDKANGKEGKRVSTIAFSID